MEILEKLTEAFKFRRRYDRIIHNPVLLHLCNDNSIFNHNQQTVLRDFSGSFTTNQQNQKKKKSLSSSIIDINVKLSKEEEVDIQTFLLSLSNFGTSFLEIHFSYLTNLRIGKKSSTNILTIRNRIQAQQYLKINQSKEKIQ